MIMNDTTSTLFDNKKLEILTIKQMADWHQHKLNEGSRLLLPPIQRSVVWSNEQIINYWDSLLRGYPPGMMLVHRVTKKCNLSRDENGKTLDANDRDFQLFDGQQRMAAILLGFGKGQMANDRKLWVDFGTEPNKGSGLRFQLRITSTGQPFGYSPDAPNKKVELSKRQEKWAALSEKNISIKVTPQQIFKRATGGDIIDSKCAVPFACVFNYIQTRNETNAKLPTPEEGALATIVDQFIDALKKGLESQVVLQQVDSNIVADQEEYIRFFTRLGQGGTRLSDDELTYSIIKHQYPKVHDRMTEIAQDAGHLAGEVDLVLAALRVAKTITPWEQAKEWEIISRPSPIFVSQLKNKPQVESKFSEMIGLESPTTLLGTALKQIRSALSYNASEHPAGLPAMLLARLPRDLVDVLILFTVKQTWKEDGRATVCAFVLHWLLFVSNNVNAAWRSFQHGSSDNWRFDQDSIRKLIGEFEEDGTSRRIPKQDSVFSDLTKELEKGDHQLRPWAERFKAADGHDVMHNSGEALRVLSTNQELVKRALMWFQRDYIAKEWPDYDPTSDRDEDLPIDLDHIVPADLFGFNGNSWQSRLQGDAWSENFRDQRHVCGNSLGNYRWLEARENRQRGKQTIDNNEGDIKEPDLWNNLIRNQENGRCWSKEDIATFQRIIDQRTVYIYWKILNDSGIYHLMATT